jgi:hypothetical protein
MPKIVKRATSFYETTFYSYINNTMSLYEKTAYYPRIWSNAFHHYLVECYMLSDWDKLQAGEPIVVVDGERQYSGVFGYYGEKGMKEEDFELDARPTSPFMNVFKK